MVNYRWPERLALSNQDLGLFVRGKSKKYSFEAVKYDDHVRYALKLDTAISLEGL